MEPVDTTDPELADMVETATAVIHRVVPIAEITDFFDRSFTELATVLARQGLAPAGPAFPATPGADFWEVYVTEPNPDTDPVELRTELCWAVEQ